MPDPIKQELHRMLREDRMRQADILAALNELCIEEGLPAISQISLSRYSVRMRKMGQKVIELRDVSAIWVEKLGEMPEGDAGKLLLEIIRTLSVNIVTGINEDDEVSIETLNQLALLS
ncbi:phage protein Gp27 family protein [Endozoicomonas gorgoniicola]|uniref:phage protein Gp27 family protein n=1 Tax=Endozoicomonas gorgoniicola TaxID=1234144 RepID=UPI002AD56B58|nr:phage protein Gp27 family protein [Endozoicomonas gorgoniicola]